MKNAKALSTGQVRRCYQDDGKFWEQFLPSVSDRAPKFERSEVKFLQLNLEREWESQYLLMQMSRERGADVLLISEQ